MQDLFNKKYLMSKASASRALRQETRVGRSEVYAVLNCEDQERRTGPAMGLKHPDWKEEVAFRNISASSDIQVQLQSSSHNEAEDRFHALLALLAHSYPHGYRLHLWQMADSCTGNSLEGGPAWRLYCSWGEWENGRSRRRGNVLNHCRSSGPLFQHGMHRAK